MATNQQNRDTRDQGKQGNTQGGSSYQRDSSMNGGRMIGEGSSNHNRNSSVNEWNRDETPSSGDEF